MLWTFKSRMFILMVRCVVSGGGATATATATATDCSPGFGGSLGYLELGPLVIEVWA